MQQEQPTRPVQSTQSTQPRLPAAVPYIIGNEAAERFSFYGMKAVLMVYMTNVLLMSDPEAAGWGHLFAGSICLFPIAGAILADMFLGKYRVIFWLSLVYCMGHAVLALPGSVFGGNLRLALAIGLSLIAIGSGGIKSCVTSIVGDQFHEGNQTLLERVFGWFYLSINVGAFVSAIITPVLFHHYGHEVAFAIPGILMGIATLILWLGRKKYVIVPPSKKSFFHELKSPEVRATLGKVFSVFLFLIPFWAVYEQCAYRWVGQAKEMNGKLFETWAFLPDWLRNIEVLPSQMNAFNPFLILVLVPIFSYVIYPLMNRRGNLTIVRKMAIGFVTGCIAAVFPLVFEYCILSEIRLNLGWQFLAYFFLTAAEVMVSITSLEFAYTQAPRTMKAIVMSAYLLMTMIANFLCAGVNALCNSYKGFLSGTGYYWFFFLLLVASSTLFFFVAARYREKTYLQETAVAEKE
ncbi:MAG: MFS transporter [Planctomycetia bacterium]|nr:MFS transporter [Planctomycetia bacterium]